LPSDPDLEGELALLVEALDRAERRQPVDLSLIPRQTICWFLDHAERFRPVAYASLRLLALIAAEPDGALRARVGAALEVFAGVQPALVEELVLSLASDPSFEVRASLLGATAALLQAQGDQMVLVERFCEYSAAARETIERARMLLGARATTFAGAAQYG
jgi:hypothetical protein